MIDSHFGPELADYTESNAAVVLSTYRAVVADEAKGSYHGAVHTAEEWRDTELA